LNIADSETKLTIGYNAFSNVRPIKAYLGRNISRVIFTDNTNLSDLTIGGKVSAINDSEFKGCTALAKLSLSNPVTTIGSSAFNGCSGLTALLIPSSVTSIGASAFSGCTSIAELKIADSETKLTIGDEAFSNVRPTMAYLGRNISSAIFTDNTNLTDLTIGGKTSAINVSEFKGCTELSAVTLNNITTIGSSAFEGCTALAELSLPNSVSTIGSSAFSGCTAITKLSLLNSVTSIGSSAFSGCIGITTLKFEDGESKFTLGDDAFKDVALTEVYFGRQMDFSKVPCTAMRTIEFGKNVTSITSGAFKDAKSLLKVTSHNSIPPTTTNTFSNETYLDGTLYVPKISIDSYKAATGWKDFWEIKALDGGSSGIPEIGNNNEDTFSVENGAIYVNGDADVRIVSMNGTTVYSGRGETRINVAPGIYVVIINNVATKVVVK
jgi:hypothetical protein